MPWGGSEELWGQTAARLIIMGHKIAICTRWKPLPEKIKFLEAKSNCEIIEKSVVPSRLNKFLPGRFKIFRESYKKDIISWMPDLAVISQGNNTDGLEWMEFCLENSIKYVSISQAVYEGIWPAPMKAERLAKVYGNAERNYFVSEANRQMTELMIATAINNSKVIRNPFNVKYITEIDFPDTEKGYSLACVARYEFYAKGQDVLLEVLSDKIWKERNLIVNFYGKGPDEISLRKLIDFLGVKNVKVNAFTNTTEIWVMNHALVLPSRFEGLPLALVEAMLCGRFGIVTDVSGNAELIQEEITGFIAAAPKAAYLHEAIERAWARREEWRSIGANAKIHIKGLVPEDPIASFCDELMRLV